MGIKLPDARHLSDAQLETLRLRALRGCEMGLGQAQIAQMLGVARETVSRWWCAHLAQDMPGLRTGRPQGVGRFLDDQQATHLQQLIDNNSPAALGIQAALWSRRAVRDLICKQFDINLAVRTVGDYLKRWGYTAKKPRRHAKKQDPDEVSAFLEETYPKIESKARKEHAEIFWCDETGVAADETPGVGYARKGEWATLEVPPPHIRVNVISAISNTGELRFMTYKGMLDAALFLLFLKRLGRTTKGKVYLFVDQLRAHLAVKVATWLARHKDRIEVIPMPRYSPELNPAEYLNNDIKGNIHKRGMPDNKKELQTRITRFLRWRYNWPARVASYFKHPCVLFASK
jgi:transposase